MMSIDDTMESSKRQPCASMSVQPSPWYNQGEDDTPIEDAIYTIPITNAVPIADDIHIATPIDEIDPDPPDPPAPRKRLLIGAVLLIVMAALAVGLALRLTRDPLTPSPTVQPIDPRTESPLPTPVPSPNVIPTDLMNLISEKSFDGGAAARNTSTPQNKAVHWLAGNTNLNSTYSDETKIQRYALATLYYSTGGGETWDLSGRWLTNEDECGSWDSLWPVCSNKVAIKLALPHGLQGTIPDEIALLSDLAELYIKDNSGLIELIPSTIAQMTKLKQLFLSHNSFMGSLPSMGQLTKLVDASFSGNHLSGRIPSTIGQLSSLQQLGLFENELTGPIPTEISRMTELRYIRFYANKLTGSIPNMSPLMNLKEVRFDYNDMTGTIPSIFSQMTDLATLRLNNNSFSGTFQCPKLNDTCLVSCNDVTDPACGTL